MKADLMETLEEYVIINVPPIGTENNLPETTENTSSAPCAEGYGIWNSNRTEALIDLYGKYKEKVGTMQTKTQKKLKKTIATELNTMFNINVIPANVENGWCVLERNYKKYVDNKNKTGKGRKFFKYSEVMDNIFKKKKNVHPEILLSSDTVTGLEGPRKPLSTATDLTSVLPTQHEVGCLDDATSTEERNKKLHISSAYTATKNSASIPNRNKILESMRKDRLYYQNEKLKMKNYKLRKSSRRNELVEERNKILKIKYNISDNLLIN